jgi:hypothetical protein
VVAQRTTDTFDEWLAKTLNQVQQGKTVQDALSGDNYDFVSGLETTLLARMHQPIDQVTGQQPGGGAPQGMPPGPPPSQVPSPPPGQPPAIMSPAIAGVGGPAGPQGGPSPMGGAMPSPALPSADELARVLGAQAQ